MTTEDPLERFGKFTETRYLGLILEERYTEAQAYAQDNMTDAEKETLRSTLALGGHILVRARHRLHPLTGKPRSDL